MSQEKICNENGCRELLILTQRVDRIENEFSDFKRYTYDKFDELKDLKERFIKFEAVFAERMNNLKELIEKMENKKENRWLVFLGQFIYPLVITIITILFYMKTR